VSRPPKILAASYSAVRTRLCILALGLPLGKALGLALDETLTLGEELGPSLGDFNGACETLGIELGPALVA
jgi:hypothetical protein